MADEENKGGRPEITEEEKKEMLQKLEPYLKSGLSVRKALREAGIPNSTFYMLKDRDTEFLEQINRFQQFISVLLNSSIVRQLQDIIKKQNAKVALAKEEIEFMKWFATNSNQTKEEYGERKNIGFFDPEAEVQRLAGMIDDSTEEEEGNEHEQEKK